MIKAGKILVVDDEAIIRQMLQVELEDKYDVVTAVNSYEALKILEKQGFDLVISDINMPGMKGYELLKIVREKWPATRVSLITAYDINEYVHMARLHGVSNIIPKTTPFNFNELHDLINGLITMDIFGIQKHLTDKGSIVREYVLKKSNDIDRIEEMILSEVSKFHRQENNIYILLEEIITNAIYHGITDAEGRPKYRKHSDVTLDPNEYVYITLGRDDEKYGIAIMDNGGCLDRDKILEKLERHLNYEGLLDESGRGIFMSRIYADRLIFNIHRGKKTEVIFFNYFSQKYKGFKPLYIKEI
jgi:CheY-like chemotaxis protein